MGTLVTEKEYQEAVELLKSLISIPSLSNEEDKVSVFWEKWLKARGVENVRRYHNNIYATGRHFDKSKPVLMLNSHMDTVKPASSWTKDPFVPKIEDGRLYGLGSNDAGGAGISLATVFLKYKDREDFPFNLLLAISASEEKMGENGMRALLPHLKEEGLYPSMAIVGEPTGCKAAIAERGLVVCDAQVKGKSGHAARGEGINAIYRAIEDIEKLKNFQEEEPSKVLGPIKVTVTMIEAGTQHNVVPDICTYVIDLRTTDAHTNEETVTLLREKTEWSEIEPRSTRIRASVLNEGDLLLEVARKTGMETYVSPTTSDMALMHDFSSIKIGPGESERSHTADEFIKLEEIRQGIETYSRYINTLSQLMKEKNNNICNFGTRVLNPTK